MVEGVIEEASNAINGEKISASSAAISMKHQRQLYQRILASVTFKIISNIS